ncbi:MAG: CPBP family intramembrane metalloprotease [Oscillospiraceae bacterium]|nr:CPBP family intramembrane metalloprotease [Oscillospiraceae bacterium]
MTDRKKSIVYIVCAYLFFWIAFSLIGAILMLMGEDMHWFQEGVLFQLMVAFAAWTPTFALFALFRKLYPGSSIKAFYKNAFRERLNATLLLCITAVQLLFFFGAVGIAAFVRDVAVHNLLDLSLPTLLTGVLWTAMQGATGEQSGWRGFLQPHMEKRFCVIKASIIVGIVAGFWHAPLWFTSGYLGLELVQFIVLYMIGITCVAVIIGICYNRCRNLFVPIWIHFMFNFTLTMYTGETLALLTWLTALYVPVAIGYVVWHKRSRDRRMEK